MGSGKLRPSLYLGTILTFGAFSTGCQQLTQAEIKFLETRELDLPMDDAYKAAANGLFSLGFTITHSDKESGILTGKRHDPNTGGKIAGALALGVLGLLAVQDINHDITFMLTPLEPEVTQLRMKVLLNGKPNVDRKLMTDIWQRIEREAMLETRPASTPLPGEHPAPKEGRNRSAVCNARGGPRMLK